jgi:L-lactate dehydrogenase
MNTGKENLTKINIIGIGNVGSALACALISRFDDLEIILTDIDSKKLKGEYIDLSNMSFILGENKITMSNEPVFADIYVHCYGKNSGNMVSREKLYEFNKEKFSLCMQKVGSLNPLAWNIIATNPTGKLGELATMFSSRIICCSVILDNTRIKQSYSYGRHESPICVDLYREIMDSKGYTNFGVVGEIVYTIQELLYGIKPDHKAN